MRERFSGSAGLQQYSKLEHVLISGTIDDEHTAVLSLYREIDVGDLKPQLQMFRRTRSVNTVAQALVVMKSMLPEVRAEFRQVRTLLKPLLVSPASSADAERSFSALRRLKTWLRSTMTETRLNAVAVCHVHQQKLDDNNLISIKELIQQFVTCSEMRKDMFGEILM